MSGVTSARWLMPRQRGVSDACTMSSPFSLRGPRTPSRTIPRRRDARAAESDGLENHCAFGHRGFKSHSLRNVLFAPFSTAVAKPRLWMEYEVGRWADVDRGAH